MIVIVEPDGTPLFVECVACSPRHCMHAPLHNRTASSMQRALGSPPLLAFGKADVGVQTSAVPSSEVYGFPRSKMLLSG
eukprot:scaffold128693_cov19-Tisochrysis_lutea.AAC.1